MTPALRISDLTVAYHHQPVLWDVDFIAPQGTLTGIIGPNGAGKSTLIKAAMQLIPKASGTVQFFGQPLAEARRRVAYVPQRSAVDWDFPASALDVVMMGLYPKMGWLKWPGRTERAQALACLAEVGMADLASRQISELSGGQQQRVFLARALAQDADLLLMDEPFAAVDAATELELASLLRKARSMGKTAVIVHHDLGSAKALFDRVLLLNVKSIADGPVDEVLTEENLRLAYGLRAFLAPDEPALA